jgi:alpha-mannosidase
VVCGGKQTASAIRVSNKNVIVDTVKLADDGSGDLIVRLYESMNGFTHCKLTFGFDVKQVFITNMLEDNREEVQIADNSIELNIKAFQVVTLRVRR